MKTYFFDSLNRYKRFSQKLDALAEICNRSWNVINDSNEKEVFIFQEDSSILCSVNGKVTKGQWQYIAANNSLILTLGDNSFMLHPYFYDNDVFILQMDGIEEYVFLGNESKLSIVPKSVSEMQDYLDSKYKETSIENVDRVSMGNPIVPIIGVVSCLCLLLLASVLILGSDKSNNKEAIDPQTEWEEFIAKRDAEIAEQRRVNQETEIESFINYSTIYTISRNDYWPLFVIDGDYTPQKVYKYRNAEVRFTKHRVMVLVGGSTYSSIIKSMKFVRKEDMGTYQKAIIETEDGYVNFCEDKEGEFFLDGKYKNLTFVFNNGQEQINHGLIGIDYM